ncbi:MAG: GNAT family N-acetyltransferase [Saprospiraceae bacterium]|nr:GNAT family N-acetyltransferase [Saprospiraceae bacterium]
MKIRLANTNDLVQINEIYNLAIPSKKSTAHTCPISIEEREEWFSEHNDYKYPVFVTESDDKILGWISLSPYRCGRMALQYVAEVSYYIHPDFQRNGIASKLMDYVIKNAHKYEFKNLIAILLEHNTPSIKLLEKFGFEKWGHLPDIADFDGKEYGHLYYGVRVREFQIKLNDKSLLNK